VAAHLNRQTIKVVLGISRTNADSHWNPVYTAFRRICYCENEQLVSSNANIVIRLDRQICSGCQCLHMAAGSKHRALVIYFSRQIC